MTIAETVAALAADAVKHADTGKLEVADAGALVPKPSFPPGFEPEGSPAAERYTKGRG